MRVLVVEDEKRIAELLKQGLESECFVVDIAKDGKSGSDMARQNQYDIIVLDNLLPHKHGIDICKEIRAEGKATPVLMLSVKSDTTTKVDVLNAGADDYMTKPFSFEELLARLRALLRRPQEVQGDVLTVGDLKLDSRRQYIERDGRKIYLTRKEFALLKYFMKNVGTVLSRGLIMEHVWDMNADPLSNTIESHIVNLRKKITNKDEEMLIHTIPGRGYKMESSL